MESRKLALMNLFAGQQWRHRLENRLEDAVGGGELGRTSEQHWNLRIAAAAAAKWCQLCPTLCDPIDGSPTGSSVPGILQARTLEWVAISFSNHESEK